ncbi:hypothetical protein MD484_g4407, partial [Candolleomyces efflorescens]
MELNPHRRFNPLLAEYVLVSPHRAKRPWLGQVEDPQNYNTPGYDPKCFLCPSNPRTTGHKNPDYASVFTFPNDFAAVLPPPMPALPSVTHPLLQIEPVVGACDVVVFHPRHDLTLARLGDVEIINVIEEWCRIYVERGNQPDIQHVQIFENKGSLMGCSNPHPHCQVWSTSAVPTTVAKELESLSRYSLSDQSASSPDAPKGLGGRPCLLCDYAHLEASDLTASRVVVKNNDWIAVVPWWAIWPYEILLLPYRRHVLSLLNLSTTEKLSLASIISQITIRYDNLFSCSFPYSMGIHQRPTPKKKGLKEEVDDHDVAHLHFHFEPPLLRSATVKKFLVGYELMAEPQRDLTPEQAATRLAACSNIHFTNAAGATGD